MVQMEVHVTVVSVGAYKYNPLFRQPIDELTAQRTAVRCAPLRKAPAVVDDQALPIGFGDVLHPREGIQRRGLVDHERRK